MASSGERRMLFDTRGRRKHVIRVVYAILALLMGASLFLVLSPINIASLIGSSNSSSSASKVFHEQAERIEGRLAKSPDDEQLLLALTRTRINAGNSQVEVTSATETPTFTAEAKEDFNGALEAWNRYLKQTDEPSPTVAQLVGATLLRMAEGSSTGPEASENVSRAVTAQRIAAEQQPSLGSLSTLAIYQYFNGEYAAGDKATKQAAAKAPSKAEAKAVEKQLAIYRKRSKAFQKQKKEAAKAQSEAGKAALQGPLGLGGVPGG